MNHSRRDPFRTILSAGIALLMLTLGMAVPVLEQDSIFHRPVVESEHNPGECPSGHDHTICTQVGANLAIDADHAERPIASAVVDLSVLARERALTPRSLDEANPSRAPPLA